MSPTTSTVTNLIKTFIHSVEDVQKTFSDLTRRTKVELNALWNKIREIAANIPNPSCIGGAFELVICITNGSEWLTSKLGQINQARLEIAEVVQEADNVTAAAENPPRASDTTIVIYTLATKIDADPDPKLVNPGRFVIDSTKSANNITINKFKHDMKLKEYAYMSIVNSAIQYYLRKIFRTNFFADMLTSDNFLLNKYTALQMRQHLNTKFYKLNPNHIKDVYVEFELPPKPYEPIRLYLAKQRNCISLLADTNKPITKAKRLRTLIDHLQYIPLMQPVVDNYHKLV